MAEPVIVVEGLKAAYGERVILDQVSFEVAHGEILVILGGSGCGKSTLLKHLVGLHPLAGGRVSIQGVDLVSADDEALRDLRQEIGVLFQGAALFGSMTLGENVALPIEEFTDLPRDLIRAVVETKLDMVGLGGYGHLLPSELSGGMRKRAGLARALALDPPIVFFDEPSAGLDPVTSAELDELIKRINSAMGTTMVIVTHELYSIFNVAHRVIMLDKDARGIIAEGDPKQLRDQSQDPRVRGFFNRIPRQSQDMRRG